MLKCNSKKAKENIKKTVLEEIELFLEERKIETDKPATAYFEIVNAEKFYQKYPNDFEMLKDWMQGLGGYVFSTQVYLHDAKKIIMQWLEETEAEANKFTEAEAEEKAVYLFYRELKSLISKENAAKC